jgi:hypothetical protein
MREGTVAFDLRVGENEKSKRRARRWVILKASVFSNRIQQGIERRSAW